MFTGIIGGIVSGIVSVIPGLASVIGNTIVKKAETQAAREGAQDKSGNELALGWLSSINAANAEKSKYNTEKMLIGAFILFTLPTGIHWWAVMLDSMPFLGHKVGSWRVAAPPGAWGVTYHAIIQSFYIMAPATAGLLSLARAFRR
jgi:hypothetical protein